MLLPEEYENVVVLLEAGRTILSQPTTLGNCAGNLCEWRSLGIYALLLDKNDARFKNLEFSEKVVFFPKIL
jgi:hypothetical protein